MAFILRYYFEHGAGPLWAADDPTELRYGIAVSPDDLPLSLETKSEIDRLGKWYWQSLNQHYPPDPSPWRQEECDQFNQAVTALLGTLRNELGPEFTLMDQQVAINEDPDLDEYLKAPKTFKRRSPR